MSEPPSPRPLLVAVAAVALLAEVIAVGGSIPFSRSTGRRTLASVPAPDQRTQQQRSVDVLQLARRVRVAGSLAAITPVPIAGEPPLRDVTISWDARSMATRLGVRDVATRGPPIHLL
jgi:hypothetical protein